MQPPSLLVLVPHTPPLSAWLPAWPQREHRLWIFFPFPSPCRSLFNPSRHLISPQFTQSHLSLRASKNICFLWPGVYAVLHVGEGNKPLLSYIIDGSSVNVLESSTTSGGGDKALDSMQCKVLSIVTKVLRKRCWETIQVLFYCSFAFLLQSPALKRQWHGSNKNVKSPHNFNTQYFYCLCYLWLHQKPWLKKNNTLARLAQWALLLLPPSVMDCRCLAVL